MRVLLKRGRAAAGRQFVSCCCLDVRIAAERFVTPPSTLGGLAPHNSVGRRSLVIYFRQLTNLYKAVKLFGHCQIRMAVTPGNRK